MRFKEIVVNRRGAEDVAMIAATELNSLLETGTRAQVTTERQASADCLEARSKPHHKTDPIEKLRRELRLDLKG